MATGANDSNGIYQYGEDDPIDTWSGYMNLLAATVSAVVTAIKTRLTSAESNITTLQAKATLAHAEYTGSFPSIANTGGPTAPTAAPTVVSASSVASPATWFTPVASGIQVVKAGVYEVLVTVNLTAIATGRSFCNILANGVTFRQGTSSDDNFEVSARVYVPAGGTISPQLFQTTGAARTATYRMHVDYIGSL